MAAPAELSEVTPAVMGRAGDEGPAGAAKTPAGLAGSVDGLKLIAQASI